jgi:hypothetical protein
MIQQEKIALQRLAQCWNNLDTRFIVTELADDVIYESQWVLIPIKGRTEFLSYLQIKFQAIKSAMQSEIMSVSAELALHPKVNNRPCLVLTQITKNGIIQVSVFIELRESKIICIDVCFLPDPTEAKLTGEFPK